MIFTTKSLIYTCAAGAVGLIFYFIFGTLLKLTWLGIALTIACAALGFVVATIVMIVTGFDTNALEITRKAGGENIDTTFLKWMKFKRRGNVIYTYLGTEEEKNNG